MTPLKIYLFIALLTVCSFSQLKAQNVFGSQNSSSGEISGAPLTAPIGQTLQETLTDVRIKRNKDFINEIAPTPSLPNNSNAPRASSGIIAPPGTDFLFVPQNQSDASAAAQKTPLPQNQKSSAQGQNNNNAQKTKKIQFNFKSASLSVVIDFIAKLYGLVPVTSSIGNQQVSISTPGEVSPETAYAIFTSVINNMNYAVVRTDRYLQVVPKSNAQQYPIKILYGDEPAMLPDNDEMIMMIVPCKNMAAAEMQKYIVPIISSGLGTANVTADPSSNLLIVTDVATNLKRIIKMVKLLDVAGRQKFSSMVTSVYYISYMNAKDMAECLNNAFKIQSTVTVRDGVVENNQIIIQPFLDGNAILVTAVPSLQKVVGDTIRSLDKRKKQVLLEVKLIEANRARNFDLSSDLTIHSGSSNIQAGTQVTITEASNLLTDSTKTPELSYIFLSDRVNFAVQALLEKTNGKLLSQPRLLTADNQKASLIIGQQEPILKSTTTVATTANGNVVSDYSYLNLGITLTITPHINPDNDVTLNMDLKISNILSRVTVGDQSVPELSNRQIQTTAAVKHNHTLVIGGIISQDHTDTQKTLPGLGDIPLIGWMFGQHTEEHVQTELIILISPYVIEEIASADSLTKTQTDKISLKEKDFEHFDDAFNDVDGEMKFGDQLDYFLDPQAKKNKKKKDVPAVNDTDEKQAVREEEKEEFHTDEYPDNDDKLMELE